MFNLNQFNMKNLNLLLIAFLLIGSVFAQQNSNVAPSDYTPTYLKSEVFANPTRNGECNFLVLRNNFPWDVNATVPLLLSQGHGVTTANSSEFPSMNFDDFDVIIVESDQNAAFHTAFSANFSKFVSFVQNGGRLQIHAATYGWNSPLVPVNLPGGVSTAVNLDNYNVVVDASHPIVTGVPSPFYGNYASHGYFTNLYPGTNIITAEQSSGKPTTIQYTFGNGTVTATTCTYEFGYSYNQAAGIMYQNNLQYSCDYPTINPPAPVPLSNWALYVGIALMLTFVVFRFRRIF